MPTVSYQMHGTPNEFAQAQTITKKFTLPEDFTGVNGITTTPAVDPSKVSYTISGREITITLSSVDPTITRKENGYAYLISDTPLPGDDDVHRCTYDDGSSFLTVGSCPFTRSSVINMSYYEYTATLDYVANIPPVLKINGQAREVEKTFCKVNGVVREVEKMWTKVNGQLRDM